jgi:hypothetical protein
MTVSEIEGSTNPKRFKDALDAFMSHVAEKAIRRAKEKGRPMDPWNVYEPEFIRARLVEEIGEWLANYTTNDNENNNGTEQWQAESDELYDITALACSLWMTKESRKE